MGNDRKKDLELQHPHWENHWGDMEKITESPSEAAKLAVEKFKERGITKVLELGGGLGRDTIYIAKQGFQVYVLEYTEKGIQIIRNKARVEGLSESIIPTQHDVRNPLPFADDWFEGCFSHMLYCMAFTDEEQDLISHEIKRVLKPGGMNMYTVRNIKDPMYKTGIHRGGNMYEIEGFIINFFDETMIRKLSKGFELQHIIEFEEGALPKKLYFVILNAQ
ncbi:class I SAM-dependent methyltransferase [Bacillus solitudinis]|uniref:class I SAM-dependent methyltransferase n=1 Tax=Bacillus solitudinis TaxID=2014074 RepID=UPI0018E20CD9|nr:class I SAM-dependent methyltransferase [Bacillus solitudinis]